MLLYNTIANEHVPQKENKDFELDAASTFTFPGG